MFVNFIKLSLKFNGIFFPAVLRPDSNSWTHLTGLRDHTLNTPHPTWQNTTLKKK